jgi:transposase
LPGCNFGINAIIYSAIQHYLKGITISKVVWNLNFFGLKNITDGALISQWHTLAAILKPTYEEIKSSIHNETESVNADETGWRERGKKFWVWLAAAKDKVLIIIKSSRDAISAQELLGNDFKGVLCTDFWSPYLKVNATARQFCLRHFLNEFEKIELNRTKPPPEYYSFKYSMKRLIYAAMKFAKREIITLEQRNIHYNRYLRRLDEIASIKYTDKDVLRLIKRIKRCREGFFTFVRIPNVEPTNNFGEQQIRGSVVMRKNSFHTMSEQGSETLSILMTVFMTLDIQKKDVFLEVKKLVEAHLQKETLKQKFTVAA